MVIEYSNPNLEQAIKAVKDIESSVIELNDGSIFYVTEDGKAYQAFDGIQLEKAVVAGSRIAINAEILPDPEKMTTDYVYGHIGIGLTKTLSTNVGYIIDKAGNVYMFDQEQSGVGVAPPIYGGYGKGTIETNWKHQEENNIVNAIIGNSSGISVTSIVSASVSASEDSMIITVEIGVETSAGVSMSRRHARKVGNIYER